MMQIQKPKQGYKIVKSLFGKYEEIPEDWKFRTLMELGEIIGGGTPDTTNEEYWGGDVWWAVPTDITKLQTGFIDKTERTITEKGLKESSAKLLPVKTILITSRATIGECAINTVPMSTNQGFQNLICNQKNDNQFVFYAIKFHKKKLLRLAYGTTFLEISKSEMKKTSIPITESKTEQQKIASILSNIDSLIQQTQKGIEHTQRLKKGLMQRLLTKGIGHTIFKTISLGPIFPKMNIPNEWKIQKLSYLADVVDSRHYTPEYTQNGIPLILPNNVKIEGLDLTDTKFTSKEDYLKLVDGRRNPEVGDIVYSRNATFGIACRVENEQRFSLGQDLVLIKPIKIDPYLLLLILNSNIVWLQLSRLVTGTTFKRINLDLIREFIIPYSNDPNEQSQISKLIMKIKSQIDALQSYKSNLENLKKGLMQKLLTGQIRVKV